MLSPSTVRTARQVAEALTENNLVVTAKEASPLAVMAGNYHVGAPGLKREISARGYTYLANYFEKLNRPEGDTPASDERDQLVDLIATGTKNILTTVRQILLPAAKGLHEQYVTFMKQAQRHAKIEVKACAVHAIHENDRLLGHLEGYPRKHRLKATYRSFVLPEQEAGTLIEWLSKTSLVDDATVKSWAVERLKEEELMEVWYTLFGSRRELAPTDMGFTSRARMPLNLDQILAAYFLTGELRDNPVDPQGESVSLAEWEETLDALHGFLALKLLEGYEKRQTDRRQGRLVYRYDVMDAYKATGHVCIYANADLLGEWTEQGGKIEALLGAATQNASLVYVKGINEVHDELVKIWARKHALIRGAVQTAAMKNRRFFLKEGVRMSLSSESSLPQLEDRVIDERGDQLMATLKEDDLDDAWRVIVKLLCHVFYPNSQYYSFLTAMERYGVNVDTREAATLATAEVIAQWLRDQMSSHKFNPVVVKQDKPQEVVEDASAEA